MSGAPPSGPTRRFSDRVDTYVRCRPGYPPALIDHLELELGLAPGSDVADVGSGTGILARMFIERGHRVFAVEPNQEMREAAERLLRDSPGFTSVAGAAEATGLSDSSVDLVTAGQAFHWFRADESRREFVRVLRPPRRVALVWNRRRTAGTFLRDYETLLLRFGTDYRQVDHRKTTRPEVLARFFGKRGYASARFDNEQRLDWGGLVGRLLSSSYAPLSGPDHDAMLRELRRIFESSNEEGFVSILYNTEVYYGQIS